MMGDPTYREVTMPTIVIKTCDTCLGWGDLVDLSNLPGSLKARCRACGGSGETKVCVRKVLSA